MSNLKTALLDFGPLPQMYCVIPADNLVLIVKEPLLPVQNVTQFLDKTS